MPRIIQTNPDGSNVSNYLTQSAVGRPFQTGVIRRLPSGVLFGYSGEVNYDITAAASYPMLDFQLERDSIFSFYFSYDGTTAAGVDVGLKIAIDGVTVFYYTNERQNYASIGVSTSDFLVPANKTCNVDLLNPNTSAVLVKGNVTLIGKEI